MQLLLIQMIVEDLSFAMNNYIVYILDSQVNGNPFILYFEIFIHIHSSNDFIIYKNNEWVKQKGSV